MTRDNQRQDEPDSLLSDGEGKARPLSFFFGTRHQPCPYLDGRMEAKVVTDLSGHHAQAIHDELSLAGFRRSHNLTYKPACLGCDACVPVRIPVARFEPSRSQRRIWRRNADLAVQVTPARATLEHYALFDRYQQARHAGGGMASMSFADFSAMVEESPVDTRLVEARDNDGELVAVSLTDWLRDGFSGVYKFFAPELAACSLGTFLVLWHIDHARRKGLDHVYLGYWIGACGKMNYKTRFAPLEALLQGRWRDLDAQTRAAHGQPASTKGTDTP
ncbi:MAG: arginyltransferase [Proteobacteria bacterium]|nr:arginyltransferase [Pseudomonadota bacterium]